MKTHHHHRCFWRRCTVRIELKFAEGTAALYLPGYGVNIHSKEFWADTVIPYCGGALPDWIK